MEGGKRAGDLLRSAFLETLKFVLDLPKWKFLPGKNILSLENGKIDFAPLLLIVHWMNVSVFGFKN